MTTPTETATIQPVIGMPSADLITYRFDQLDAGQASLHKKLGELTNTFVTKEELKVINQRLDNWTWYWRAIVTGFITLTVYIVASKAGKW